MGNKQWNILQLREMLEQLIPNNKIINGYLVYHKFPEIGEKYMLLNARKVGAKDSPEKFDTPCDRGYYRT
jgi:hypothetical protein